MHNSILKEKVAIVTGASRGIGKSIAEYYAQKGAIVYANVREKTDENDMWLKQFTELYDGEIRPCYFDLTVSEQTKVAVNMIWREHKKIDILVNNAGVEYNENIGMILPEHMLHMFQVNIIGLIEVTQWVAKFMMRGRQGSIINIASVVGRYGSSGQSVYSATKGAVISFTKSAAKELGKYNIRVNAVAPGITKTDMVTDLQEEFLNKRLDNIPLGRMAEPGEIANACVFLASDFSDFISGQILGVDGGTTL